MLLFNPRVILEKTWETIDELTSRRVKELKLNDAITSYSSEPNTFNDHFSTIRPRLANEIPPTAIMIQVVSII